MSAARGSSQIPSAVRARQSGVVLFIALIVLVAMTLAGLAIMRSVDTGNLVAGNVAFKQGTLMSADRAIDVAFNWLTSNVSTGVLNTDSPADAYYAAVSDPPDWSDPSVWSGNSKVVGTDAAGNTIEYMIHRLCSAAGIYSSVNCSQTLHTGGEMGNSQSIGGLQFTGSNVVYYRVTARVTGARGTSSIVQSTIGVQM